MKDYLQSRFYGFSYYLEMFISLILTLVIIMLSGKLFLEIFDLNYVLSDTDSFQYFLASSMNLAVGVELIKMLCKHTPGTVVEVLLFAIARQIIIAHSSVYETLLGVVCIAILFATRKFLFIAHDEVTKITLRGSNNIRMANRLARIHIPDQDGPLLRDAITKRLTEEDRNMAVGACVDYHGFSLCISSINHDVITRVDILKNN